MKGIYYRLKLSNCGFSLLKQKSDKVKRHRALCHLYFKILILKFKSLFTKNLFLLGIHECALYGQMASYVFEWVLCVKVVGCRDRGYRKSLATKHLDTQNQIWYHIE